jgi:hypothetical protein
MNSLLRLASCSWASSSSRSLCCLSAAFIWYSYSIVCLRWASYFATDSSSRYLRISRICSFWRRRSWSLYNSNYAWYSARRLDISVSYWVVFLFSSSWI